MKNKFTSTLVLGLTTSALFVATGSFAKSATNFVCTCFTGDGYSESIIENGLSKTNRISISCNDDYDFGTSATEFNLPQDKTSESAVYFDGQGPITPSNGDLNSQIWIQNDGSSDVEISYNSIFDYYAKRGHEEELKKNEKHYSADDADDASTFTMTQSGVIARLSVNGTTKNITEGRLDMLDNHDTKSQLLVYYDQSQVIAGCMNKVSNEVLPFKSSQLKKKKRSHKNNRH